MASVLSLGPFVPFGAYDNGSPCRSSISSLGSIRSHDTVRRFKNRHLSINSVLSRRSLGSTSSRLAIEPAPSAYRPVFLDPAAYGAEEESTADLLKIPQTELQKAFSDPAILPPPLSRIHSLDHCLDYVSDDIESISLTTRTGTDSDVDIWHEPTESFADLIEDDPSPPRVRDFQPTQSQPFKRWLDTLQRRTEAGHQTAAPTAHEQDGSGQETENHLSPKSDRRRHEHRRSGSYLSSTAFVTGIRSASMTMTSPSLSSFNATRSPRSPPVLLRVISNVTTSAGGRRSLDSTTPSFAPSLDEAAIKRSLKRARKVQELVATERSYVADLKMLQNTYLTMMPSQSHGIDKHANTQACINDLVDLHEIILAYLQDLEAMLISYERSPRPGLSSRVYSSGGAARSSHIENVPSRSRGLTMPTSDMTRMAEDDAFDRLCTPQLAAEFARVFASRAQDLVLYEEYGMRCGYMQLDAGLHRALMPLIDYDRALEALQASTLPCRGTLARSKKALGIKDLMIKPIQRITRYELLFRDLCSLTPSCDDPVSHAVIDDALFVVSKACHELNEGRMNTEGLRRFDIQRVLQDRLEFGTEASRHDVCFQYGRLLLSGALYLAYCGTTSIKGQYAVCVLFENHLLVAAAKSTKRYNILLTIPLSQTKFERSDNGKGLQCHITPYTWKLVFEHGDSAFEIMLVACSKSEADAWQTELASRIAVGSQFTEQSRHDTMSLHSPLTEEMRSVGKVHGKTPNFARRTSVQRAATLGPVPDVNQVVIKGTTATGKDNELPPSAISIPRSQSVLVPSHIPVLAPRRSERIHLEHIMSDVWTRDALPYPGLASRFGEHSMRASANHVIRKLSIASITSNFSRRSMSHASFGQSSGSDDRMFRGRSKIPAPRPPPKPVKKVIDTKTINFHTAPEAFLPEDFELKGPSSMRGRLAGLRTFTMGSERPRVEPPPGPHTPASGMQRSQSVIPRRKPKFDTTPTQDRSHTAMSNPDVLSKPSTTDLSVNPATKPPAALPIRRRSRARSRLARLLS